MTAYQFSQPWLSKMDGDQQSNALEWAHLRDYLKGVDNGTIPLFNPNFLNFTVNGTPFTLPVSIANGGTNSTAALANGLLMVSAGGKIVEIAADTSVGSHKLTSLSSGTVSTDVANFGQVNNALVNIIDNGGFEIWQRGTSFSNPANLAYLSDRWFVETNEAATVTVTQESTTIDRGTYSVKVVTTGSGVSKFWDISQKLENFTDYRSQTLTFSCRVNTNVASSCRVSLTDGVVTTLSSYHTGGGGWETLTVTATMASNANPVQVAVGMASSGDKKNGTFYFDSAMLAVGSSTPAFVPGNPAQDFLRCQRFFQVIGGIQTTDYFCILQNTTNAISEGQVVFVVPMRAAPTLTVNNQTHFSTEAANGARTALSTLVADNQTTRGMRLTATSSGTPLVAGNATNLVSNNADASIYISADL